MFRRPVCASIALMVMMAIIGVLGKIPHLLPSQWGRVLWLGIEWLERHAARLELSIYDALRDRYQHLHLEAVTTTLCALKILYASGARDVMYTEIRHAQNIANSLGSYSDRDDDPVSMIWMSQFKLNRRYIGYALESNGTALLYQNPLEKERDAWLLAQWAAERMPERRVQPARPSRKRRTYVAPTQD